jgi:hypothetical protein
MVVEVKLKNLLPTYELPHGNLELRNDFFFAPIV